MAADRPKRYRCPIRRVHEDGSTCTHKISPSGKPRAGEDCPGVAGYEATCTCGHQIHRQGIRAIVEQEQKIHIGNHDRERNQTDTPTHTTTGVGTTRDPETGTVIMDLDTAHGPVHIALTDEHAEALGMLLLDDPTHSDGYEEPGDTAVNVMPDALELTDAQWAALLADTDFLDGLRIDDFDDIERILVRAKEVLGYAPADDSLSCPSLLNMAVWDTSDDDNADFIITVDLPGGLRLATETIDIDLDVFKATPGEGVLRAVLTDLIAYRNRLLQDLVGEVQDTRLGVTDLTGRVPVEDIELFLKRERDRHEKTDVSWHAVDDVLDTVRLYTATRTPLTEPRPAEGPEALGVGREPLTEAEELRAEVERLRRELEAYKAPTDAIRTAREQERDRIVRWLRDRASLFQDRLRVHPAWRALLLAAEQIEREAQNNPPIGGWVIAEDKISPKLNGGTVTMYWRGPDPDPRLGRLWEASLDFTTRFPTAEAAMDTLRTEFGEDMWACRHAYPVQAGTAGHLI